MARRYHWLPKLPKRDVAVLLAALTLMVEGDTGPMDKLTPEEDKFAKGLLAEMRERGDYKLKVTRGSSVGIMEINSWRAKRRAGRTVASISREAGRPYSTVYDWVERRE